MGYENSILSAGIGTSFEQYKDITASLGISASYDDLRTDSNASSLNKVEILVKFPETMDLLMTEEIEHLCQQVVQ